MSALTFPGTSASVPLVECNHRTFRHIESGLVLSLSGCIVALLLAGAIVRSPLELNQRDEWRGGKVDAADPGLLMTERTQSLSSALDCSSGSFSQLCEP